MFLHLELVVRVPPEPVAGASPPGVCGVSAPGTADGTAFPGCVGGAVD